MVTTTFSCGAGMDVFWMVMLSAMFRRAVKLCGWSVLLLLLIVVVSNAGRCIDCCRGRCCNDEFSWSTPSDGIRKLLR